MNYPVWNLMIEMVICMSNNYKWNILVESCILNYFYQRAGTVSIGDRVYQSTEFIALPDPNINLSNIQC